MDDQKDRGRAEDAVEDAKAQAREELGLPPRCTTHHRACACREWALEREIEALREALRFYADPKTHELDDANGYCPDACWPIVEDAGARARAALALGTADVRDTKGEAP